MVVVVVDPALYKFTEDLDSKFFIERCDEVVVKLLIETLMSDIPLSCLTNGVCSAGNAVGVVNERSSLGFINMVVIAPIRDVVTRMKGVSVVVTIVIVIAIIV